VDSTLTDPGAERAVLAGLLSYGMEAYVDVSDFLSPKSFTHGNNAALYKCIEKMMIDGMEVDVSSIQAAATQLKLIDVINNAQELDYIKTLMQFAVNKSNVFKYAVQVKKYEFARSAKKVASTLIRDLENITGDESIDELINMIENPIGDLLREDSTSKTPTLLGEDIDDFIQDRIDNKCDQMGIPTGYARYDASIGGGLRRGGVELISARPKTGKSVFALNTSLHVAQHSIPVLLLDTEMSKEDQIARNMANMTGVAINDVATGKFSENKESLEAIWEASKEVRDLPIHYINVSGEPIENILNLIKRWIIRTVGVDENGRTNDCVVIYDYLKLTSGDSLNASVQEYQALGFQITALHNMAVKYDFPCLALTQLNRDGITSESTASISGSDRLIWLCTSFSIFKLKSPEEIAEDGPNAGNRKLVPIVSRHGAGMQDGNYINMNMLGEYARLLELPTRDEIRDIRSNTGAIDGVEDYEGEE
jgi:replicative DNA helicase